VTTGTEVQRDGKRQLSKRHLERASILARAGFASAVLADGRVAVCGGEWTDVSGAYTDDKTNSCEIYDPVADTWSPFASPTNPDSPDVWDRIGDVPSTPLPDGTLLIGSKFHAGVAKLDPSTLTWRSMTARPTVVSSTEDSWVLMPDNTIAAPSCSNPPTVWVYDISTNRWDRRTPPHEQVVAFHEIGPGLLRYDGTAFFLGANEHTATYTAGGSPAWSNGA
jgi:hypothetical protein